jgi:hypothetical protein
LSVLYGWLADLVVVVHVIFILFVAAGAILAWRWPKLLWLHVPAVIYALAILTIHFDCPLIPLEKHLRHLAGQQLYSGGFVRHYLTDVVYPGTLTPFLQALAAVAIVVWYGRILAGGRAFGSRHPTGHRTGPDRHEVASPG